MIWKRFFLTTRTRRCDVLLIEHEKVLIKHEKIIRLQPSKVVTRIKKISPLTHRQHQHTGPGEPENPSTVRAVAKRDRPPLTKEHRRDRQKYALTTNTKPNFILERPCTNFYIVIYVFNDYTNKTLARKKCFYALVMESWCGFGVTKSIS